jgi:hypothetical protein
MEAIAATVLRSKDEKHQRQKTREEGMEATEALVSLLCFLTTFFQA